MTTPSTPATPGGPELALELTDVVKTYGNTVALDGANFSCRVGEIHGLLGENGAGKSTIVKILSGLVRPDRGDIAVMGKPVHFGGPRDALRAGIATAFQELTLIPYLTVSQNLLLHREQRGAARLISPGRTSAAASQVLEEWAAGEIDPDLPVSELSLAARQRLEVVRAFSRKPAIALMDEATAALGAGEVDWLFAQIEKFHASGGTIVYISHRMGEVRQLCGRCTVLRDGQAVRSFATSDLTDSEVVDIMAGRAVQEVYARHNAQPRQHEAKMVVDHLSCLPMVRDVSFTLGRGEILGVAGLQGHGQKELFMALFGARRATGSISVDGKRVRLRTPHDAIAAGIGISLVPEERKTEGLMVDMGGLVNVSLPSLSQFSVGGFIRRGRERAAAAKVLTTVNASLRALDQEVWSLSGGNQQKLAIGKWLMADARILLMYDPTRGVDVETKAEIFALMHSLAQEDRSILFYSTDVEELVHVADRTLVIYRGRVSAEVASSESTKESLVGAMLGHTTEAAS